MKIIRAVIRSSSSLQSRSTCLSRPFSAQPLSGFDYRNSFNSPEPTDESDKQSFSFSSIYKDLNKSNNPKYRAGSDSPFDIGGGGLSAMDDGFSVLDDGLGNFSDTLGDGMALKLKKAATYFEFDPEEVIKDNYTFRADVNFQPGGTYDTKDLDIENPGVHKPRRRYQFETNTKEVLRKADFRNVKFLANFLTEAGIIIKRSQTGISAKAQRKVAREIKTARAFGLMPFTSMGTKHFVVGNSMEDQEMDFSYEAFDQNFVDDEDIIE